MVISPPQCKEIRGGKKKKSAVLLKYVVQDADDQFAFCGTGSMTGDYWGGKGRRMLSGEGGGVT